MSLVGWDGARPRNDARPAPFHDNPRRSPFPPDPARQIRDIALTAGFCGRSLHAKQALTEGQRKTRPHNPREPPSLWAEFSRRHLLLSQKTIFQRFRDDSFSRLFHELCKHAGLDRFDASFHVALVPRVSSHSEMAGRTCRRHGKCSPWRSWLQSLVAQNRCWQASDGARLEKCAGPAIRFLSRNRSDFTDKRDAAPPRHWARAAGHPCGLTRRGAPST
jgi:hypothetical protein